MVVAGNVDVEASVDIEVLGDEVVVNVVDSVVESLPPQAAATRATTMTSSRFRNSTPAFSGPGKGIEPLRIAGV